MNFRDEEREAYEAHLKWLRIEASTLAKYESKGRAEGQMAEKRVIASNLLKKGLGPELISEATGLSLLEIKELQQVR